MNPRMAYLITLIPVLLFALYEELYLRKYLYANHDILLASSLPNFLAVVILSLSYMSLLSTDRTRLFRPIAAIVTGLIVYEIAQIWLPRMFFDVNDIFASFLGGIFSYLLLYTIGKMFTRK